MSRFKSKNVIIFLVIRMYERLKDLREDNAKLKAEIRTLREQLVASESSNENTTNNVDLLRRISQLEKVVFGKYE